MKRGLIASICVGVCLFLAAQNAWAAGKVKVFILAGQSNMEGHASVACLQYQATKGKHPELFAFCRKGNGWVTRDDVFINYLERHGKLTVGYGASTKGTDIGPELGFGFTVGDEYDEPVLIIKAAWGGRSLGRDFLPPSVGLPDEATLKAALDKAHRKNPQMTMDQLKAKYGFAYRAMIKEVKTTLANMGTRFPQLAGKTPEICGLVWFQGWNDKINAAYTAAYTKNLTAFIKDVRKDLNVPKMPFVIGELGVGGLKDISDKNERFRKAEEAVLKVPEFKGNVAIVDTGKYWDTEAQDALKGKFNPPGKSAPRAEKRAYMAKWRQLSMEAGSSAPGYHYLGSPKTFVEIGQAFAKAVIALQPGK